MKPTTEGTAMIATTPKIESQPVTRIRKLLTGSAQIGSRIAAGWFLSGILFLSASCACRSTSIRPVQPIRPRNFKPFVYPSAQKMEAKYSADTMKRAAEIMAKAREVNAKGKYQPTWESLDKHQAPEWWLDAKFGMFIDWGLYSVAAYAPVGYPDWYLHRAFYGDTREYHEKVWGKDFRRDDFIPLFTAKDFDADKIVDAAQAAGMKYVVPFLKHHDGYCLWDSNFTKRNSVEMGPRRDLARQLAESLRKRGLKLGFYYSIDDWEYPIIGKDDRLEVRLWETPGTPEYSEEKWAGLFSGKIPVRDFYDEYINPAAVEFFDKYDPDIFWGDGDWGGPDATGRKTRPMIAYFLNRAEGRKKVVFNDRLGLCRGTPKTPAGRQPNAHGDHWSSEGDYKPGEALVADHAWEENHGLSHSFGYNWRETDKDVRSAKELLHMLIDVVANGGNLLLITNLTPTGNLDPMMASRLKEVGAWLKLNGEAIYATRKWTTFRQDALRFTRSKDGRFVYVICLEWPGKQTIVKNLQALEGSEIHMLGVAAPLAWKQSADGLSIEIPESLSANRPCDHAWVLKIQRRDNPL